MRSGKTEFCRTAYVAQVPAEKVGALKAKCAEIKAYGAILRGGLYLREIEGQTYLFQYMEHCKSTDSAGFQGLEPSCIEVRGSFQSSDPRCSEGAFCTQKELGAGSTCFEPMERIFYEAGAADKTPEAQVKRIAMFTELKPEKEAHYRLLHANPWPDVIAAIHKANFRHFSIFLKEIDGKICLFGWLEYVGKDLEADGAENRKDPASLRWWKETDACQTAPNDAGGGMWGGMEELWFAD